MNQKSLVILGLGMTLGACTAEEADTSTSNQDVIVEELFDELPPNFPFLNSAGFAASASSAPSTCDRAVSASICGCLAASSAFIAAAASAMARSRSAASSVRL